MKLLAEQRSLCIIAYITATMAALTNYVAGEQLSVLILFFSAILALMAYIGRTKESDAALANTARTVLHNLSFGNSSIVRSPGELIPYVNFLQHFILFVKFNMTVSAVRVSEDHGVGREGTHDQKVPNFLFRRTFPFLTGRRH